jgi:hypothetical protein
MSHLGALTPLPPPRPVAEMHTGANCTREFLSRMFLAHNPGASRHPLADANQKHLIGQLIFSMPRTSSIYVIFIFFSYQFHHFFLSLPIFSHGFVD